jgi:hypothetical protein
MVAIAYHTEVPSQSQVNKKGGQSARLVFQTHPATTQLFWYAMYLTTPCNTEQPPCHNYPIP